MKFIVSRILSRFWPLIFVHAAGICSRVASRSQPFRCRFRRRRRSRRRRGGRHLRGGGRTPLRHPLQSPQKCFRRPERKHPGRSRWRLAGARAAAPGARAAATAAATPTTTHLDDFPPSKWRNCVWIACAPNR